MRVSRTRFSKRRSKRKTEFPLVAVVQKKKKALNKPLAEADFFQEKNTSPDNAYFKAKLNSEELKNDGANITKQSQFSFSRTSQKDIEKVKLIKPQKKSRATIDYKNVILLRNLITAEGKILPRRINKLTAKQQRHIQKAIKSARIMGLIPFINKSRPLS